MPSKFCFLIMLSLASSLQGSILLPRNSEGCGESLYVEDVVTIDTALLSANCKWKIETDEFHILAFSLIGGEFEEVQEYFVIHDGHDEDSPIILLENQIRHEIGRTNDKSIRTVYTTSSKAEIRFKKMPTSTLQIKIEKAVNCPFNLGAETQCGRVVDDSSCYCATFTKRSQPSQASFCKTNGMNLLAIESYTEESKIYAAWGSTIYLWTSLTDIKLEGTWIWESTNASLYPGYANWAALEPNNLQDTDEDCVYIRNGWYDYPCNYGNDAICELQPVIQ